MGRLALLSLVVVVTRYTDAVKFTENDEEITVPSRLKYRQETLHSHVREWIDGPDGRVYQFHAGEQSWLHAREFCLSQNSDLVIIRDKEQLDWLLSHYAPTYTRFNERYMQIGLLMPDGPNRDWVYLDGSPYNQSVVPWMSGEPFDHSLDGRERCGILRVHARLLDDIDCEAAPSPNVRMRFICEREQNVHKEQQKSQNFIWSKLEKLLEFFGFTNGTTPSTKPQNSTESSEDYEDEVKRLNISSSEAEKLKNIEVDRETSSEEQKAVEAALSVLNKVSKPGEKADSMPEEEEEETSRPGSQEDRPPSSTELLSGPKISTQAKIFIEATPITEATNTATPEAGNTTEAVTEGVTVNPEDTTPSTDTSSVAAQETTVTAEETNTTEDEATVTANEATVTADETNAKAEEATKTAKEATVTTEASTVTNEATSVETSSADTTADVTTVATSGEVARVHAAPLKEISEIEGSGTGVERAEIEQHDESANVTEIDPEKLEKKIREDIETVTAMETDFDEDANRNLPSTDIKPPEEECDEEASGENSTTPIPNEEIIRNSIDTEDVDDLSQKPKIPAEKEAHIQDFLITLRTFLSRAEHSDLRKLLDQHPEKTLLEKMKLAIKAANEREFERMKELALMKKHGVDISHVPEPKLMGESEREELYKKISRVVMVEAEKKDDETITQPSAVRTTTQESHREKKSQAKGVVIKKASDDSAADKETLKGKKNKNGKLKDAGSVIDEDNEKKQPKKNKEEKQKEKNKNKEENPTPEEKSEEGKPKKNEEKKAEEKAEKEAEQEKKEVEESKIDEMEESAKRKKAGRGKNLVSNDEESDGDLTKKEDSTTKAKKDSTTEATTTAGKNKNTVKTESVTAESKGEVKDVRPEAEDDDNSFDSEHVDKSNLDDSFDSDQVDRDDELTRPTGEEVEEEVSTVKIPPPKEEEVGTEKTPSALRKEKRRQERLKKMKENKQKKGKPGKATTKSTSEDSNYDKANVSDDDDDDDSDEVPAFPTLPTLPTLPPLGQTLTAQTLPTLPPLTPPPGFDNLLQTFSENWRKIFPDAKIPTFKADE
ncbi:unnamed protein product [Cylicocyclus nassatus]|uniref:C-type lectin domain-containing protein n=1 Tax=Cylicocyclus nassatus TaxID=53992 RepID=A0AA36M787_CYLNA|nr:unnamed protein product [Cylicocyclus nassatus]